MKLAFLCNFLASFVLAKVRQEPMEIPEIIANCRSPLGMQAGSIPDSDLSASSPFGEDYSTYGAQWARLHLKLPPYHGYRAKQSLRSGGSARNKTWIRIELRNETIITGVSTQGYGDTRVKEWVTKYTLMYSAGSGFLNFRDTSGKTKKFTGNNDSNSVQHHDVPLPVITTSVMLLPLDWNNNVGLRMELYGCAPGYYFLARLIVIDPDAFFSLAFANESSEDYQSWSADITKEITEHLIGNVPGFLRVKLRRFLLGSDSDRASVAAEVEIHCIKEAAHFVASKFVVPTDSFFQTNVNFLFPGKSGCFAPDIDILINGTKALARKVLTTSRLTLHAEVTFCNSLAKSIQSSLWEQSIMVGETLLPFQETSYGTEHVLDPRINCTDCYPVNLYLRFTAYLKQPEGRTLESFVLLKVDQPELVAKIRGPKEADKGIGEIALDASESHDPDSFAEGTLSFTWSCNSSRKGDVLFKETCQYGRMTSNGKILFVNVNRLTSKHSYFFELEVSKGKRKKIAAHVLKVHPSVNFTFRCRSNCGKKNKIIQSKTMRLEPKCEGKLCNDIISTKWSIHALNSSSSEWKTGSSFVVKDFSPYAVRSSTRNPVYKIKAVIRIQTKNDIIKEHYEDENCSEFSAINRRRQQWVFCDAKRRFRRRDHFQYHLCWLA
ncbi:uncharacterized protein LOC144635472 [Oculina patagonica]